MNTPLVKACFHAIEEENIEVLYDILKTRHDIHVIKDQAGETLLHRAARVGNKNFSKLLLIQMTSEQRAFAINKKNNHGNTALHIACKMKNDKVVKLLLDGGADFNVGGDNEDTPLHVSVVRNNEKIVRMLIDVHADVNLVNKCKNSPLHRAILNDAGEEIHKLLLDAGADPSLKNKFENTPMHEAASFVEDAIVFGAGADVKAKNEKGDTPLHVSVTGINNADIIKLLLEAGSDIEAKNNTGKTALHVAAKSDNEKSVRILLDARADVNAKDFGDHTPLHLTAESGCNSTLKLLLSRGAEVNAENFSGQTPLYNTLDNLDKMKTLVKAGALVKNIKDRYEYTLLHSAAEEGSDELVIEFLISHGCDVNAKNDSGHTPLHRATSENYKDSHLNAIEVLLKNGADIFVRDEEGRWITPMDHSKVGQLYLKYLEKYVEDLQKNQWTESAENLRKRKTNDSTFNEDSLCEDEENQCKKHKNDNDCIIIEMLREIKTEITKNNEEVRKKN